MNLPFLAHRNIFHPILVTVKQQSQVSPWRSRVAWLMLGLTVFLLAVGLLLPALGEWIFTHLDLPYSAGVSMLMEAFMATGTLLLALLGTLIIFAQPENRIGWVLSCAVFILALAGLCEKYSVYAYVIYPERELPLRELALWIQHWMGMLTLALMFIALPLLFPNGRLPSKGWRWFARWAIGVTALLCFIMAFHPDVEIEGIFLLIENDLTNPYGIAALPKSLHLLLIPVWLLFLFTMPPAYISLVVRYRRADTITRQQIKWFAFWLGMVIMGFVVREFNPILHYSRDLTLAIEIVLQLAILCLPIVLGISIFKYRLYDIDIVINRTLVYGLLTALIAGLYILIVGLLSSIFRTGDDLFASLLAVGVVAVSFQDLRGRLQRGVNRLMFGQRDEPYSILSRLGQQLHTVAAAENLLPTIAETISTALKLSYTAITIRQHDQYVMRASYGEARTPTHIVSLIYQNEHVGQLIVGQRSPGQALTPADERVLEDVARQMGAVVHAVRLTDDLQRSRERLVTTREEERRRLRRDLHDGMGPVLASNTLKLDAAIELVESAPQSAIKLLSEIKAQSQDLVTDVRRLVYQLRPPMLDELGLLETLRSNISLLIPDHSKLTITMEMPSHMPPLSAAVEAAAYRIVQEAITNIVKHANAQRCTFRISLLPDRSLLQIQILDDGVGLPQPVTSGVGLQSMRERAEELGGTFRVKNRTSGGTMVQVELPLIAMEMAL